MKSGFSWPSGFREDIWKHIHTHTFLHSRTQQLRVVPDEKILMGVGLWMLSTIFLLGGGQSGIGGGAIFDFQSSGQLAFVKMYNFLQVMVILKIAVCSNGICWNEKKKVPIFKRGLSRKKKRVMRVPWWWCWLISWPYRWWFSQEVKSRQIQCTISRQNPAISPGYFSGKLKPLHIFGTAGTHRRLNPGT